MWTTTSHNGADKRLTGACVECKTRRSHRCTHARGMEWFFGFLCQISLSKPLMKATATDRNRRGFPKADSWCKRFRHTTQAQSWKRLGIRLSRRTERTYERVLGLWIPNRYSYKLFELSERYRIKIQEPLKKIWKLGEPFGQCGSQKSVNSLTPHQKHSDRALSQE